MSTPIAFLSREHLAALPNCNGMSVWAESPSMWIDPMMPSMQVPATLVPVYSADVVQGLRDALAAYRDAIHGAQDRRALMAAIKAADDQAAAVLCRA